MKLMKKLIGASLLTGMMFGMAGAAHAEGAFSGTVALTTDYVFRGLSQTDTNPAVQGSFDYTNDIWYAGVWASNVDFSGANIETDVYVGARPTLGPVSFDLGVIGYFYPGAGDDAPAGELDYYEGKIAASIAPVEGLTLGAAVYYSPEFTGETGEALYGEINAGFAFTDAFSVSGAYGSQDIDDGDDYTTFNLGASYLTHGFKLDLRYHDTDIDDLDSIVNFTVSRSL